MDSVTLQFVCSESSGLVIPYFWLVLPQFCLFVRITADRRIHKYVVTCGGGGGWGFCPELGQISGTSVTFITLTKCSCYCCIAELLGCLILKTTDTHIFVRVWVSSWLFIFFFHLENEATYIKKEKTAHEG